MSGTNPLVYGYRYTLTVTGANRLGQPQPPFVVASLAAAGPGYTVGRAGAHTDPLVVTFAPLTTPANAPLVLPNGAKAVPLSPSDQIAVYIVAPEAGQVCLPPQGSGCGFVFGPGTGAGQAFMLEGAPLRLQQSGHPAGVLVAKPGTSGTLIADGPPTSFVFHGVDSENAAIAAAAAASPSKTVPYRQPRQRSGLAAGLAAAASNLGLTAESGSHSVKEAKSTKTVVGLIVIGFVTAILAALAVGYSRRQRRANSG